MGGQSEAASSGPLRWLGRVLLWMVTLGALGVLGVAVLVPRLAGATPYTVLTSSMKPTMPPGTLVVVRPADPEEVGVGTVVTYQLKSGEPTVVTHRVVAQAFDGKGKSIFQTQGDANDVPDAKWVRPEQIHGEKWYAVPYLGYLSNLLTGRERQMGVYIVAGLLLGYALMMVVSGFRERRGHHDKAKRKAHV